MRAIAHRFSALAACRVVCEENTMNLNGRTGRSCKPLCHLLVCSCEWQSTKPDAGRPSPSPRGRHPSPSFHAPTRSSSQARRGQRRYAARRATVLPSYSQVRSRNTSTVQAETRPPPRHAEQTVLVTFLSGPTFPSLCPAARAHGAPPALLFCCRRRAASARHTPHTVSLCSLFHSHVRNTSKSGMRLWVLCAPLAGAGPGVPAGASGFILTPSS